MELKKALTLDEQIKRLEKVHNLIISDKDRATKILQKVNYYRLSGYGIGLTQKGDSEKYIDGITLEHLYRLHCFDSEVKNLLMHTLERLEICLRAQISNHLALKQGSEGYVDSSLFLSKTRKDGQSIHKSIVQSFREEVKRQKNIPFVKHHLENYEGRFPIWVAVELFSFGNLASLYDIMFPEDREEIAKQYCSEYKVNPKHLSSWILSLVEVRNICAHYTRLYNMPLKQTPHLYREHKQFRGTQNKLFPVLLCMRRMILDSNEWGIFFTKLEAIFDEYSDVIKLSFIGFPKEWKQVLSN